MKTSFSNADFKIDYSEVKLIISEKKFRIILSNGDRYFGAISIDSTNNLFRIFDIKKGSVVIQHNNLVYLNRIDKRYIFNTLNMDLDLGYSYTNSNKLHQFNGGMHLYYMRRKWRLAPLSPSYNSSNKSTNSTIYYLSVFPLYLFQFLLSLF